MAKYNDRPGHVCRCGGEYGACAECGMAYPLGTTSRCIDPACQTVNAPIDCDGCGFVVSQNLAGVLNHDMHLIPWKS